MSAGPLSRPSSPSSNEDQTLSVASVMANCSATPVGMDPARQGRRSYGWVSNFERTQERTEESKLLCSSGDKYHCSTRALMFLTVAESIQNHQKQQPAEIS